jgi:hypothetical protein
LSQWKVGKLMALTVKKEQKYIQELINSCVKKLIKKKFLRQCWQPVKYKFSHCFKKQSLFKCQLYSLKIGFKAFIKQ